MSGTSTLIGGSRTVSAAEMIVTRATKEQCERWLGMLQFVRPGAANDKLLTQYFFAVFSRQPESLYDFLQFFRTHLSAHASSADVRPLAEKYLKVLSPLCERFGVFEEKMNADDLCFSIMQPQEHAHVTKVLQDYQRSSADFIRRVTTVLSDLMKKSNIRCTVHGRYKHVYSVWMKLRKKRLETADAPLKLYDIFAFRIILEDDVRQECFECMNILHDTFFPLAQRFKDYINIPKINGYQSIHTCLTKVVDGLDLPIELQIRTRSMDDFAEKGLASHWLYTIGEKHNAMTRTEKRLVAHFAHLSEEIQSHSVVYCCSVGGDLFCLPGGSTLRDFAYAVHTRLGQEASEALVNGQKRSLDEEIQEGDRIEIIRHSPTKKP
ncbi:bifunctional (p)ppGpp synthetase/guanosine-3',5'-bis(diphosphate) 3'-pyrophosphohydrolase [Candidatus Uhrbacteria bacterium]|nr:bifunctional (p)ppGpp synthetase/guanosine-3',5'-bis(diphosphate) 3'-pyrophosphohydrolase [Candidatus Uhrbacteria bacterium]